MSEPATILIAGPTASGKSALALALAERHGGTVINADSMQVYRDLSIITARPTAEEEARVPHRLYGHVDAAVNFSVGRWCTEFEAVLAEARGEGRAAVIVGGTGLYFSALTRGLAAGALPRLHAREHVIGRRQNLGGASRRRPQRAERFYQGHGFSLSTFPGF